VNSKLATGAEMLRRSDGIGRTALHSIAASMINHASPPPRPFWNGSLTEQFKGEAEKAGDCFQKISRDYISKRDANPCEKPD
jgi:hypothetical protein